MEYSIRVKGVVSDVVLAGFPELSARVMRRDTVLIGTLPDQAALHGLLAQIEALGLELIEVRRPRHGRSVRLSESAGLDEHTSPGQARRFHR